MDQYHHLVDPDHGIPSIRNTESRDLVVLVVVTTSALALHTLRVLLRGSVCVVSLHCCALLWLVVPCWHPLFALVLLMILLDHLMTWIYPYPWIGSSQLSMPMHCFALLAV